MSPHEASSGETHVQAETLGHLNQHWSFKLWITPELVSQRALSFLRVASNAQYKPVKRHFLHLNLMS